MECCGLWRNKANPGWTKANMGARHSSTEQVSLRNCLSFGSSRPFVRFLIHKVIFQLPQKITSYKTQFSCIKPNLSLASGNSRHIPALGEMTSEERRQKFHTEGMSLSRSGKWATDWWKIYFNQSEHYKKWYKMIAASGSPSF